MCYVCKLAALCKLIRHLFPHWLVANFGNLANIFALIVMLAIGVACQLTDVNTAMHFNFISPIAIE